MNALPKPTIDIPQDALAMLCGRWGIAKLELFGSALRKDFDPAHSDVGVLVTFVPGALPGWDFFGKLPADFRSVFGRPVDVVQRSAIERSANHIRRDAILSTAVPIYESKG